MTDKITDPKISLIIPTRNGGQYVHAPIETILSQGYTDMELIVSVNHSADDTLEVLEKYNDPRLKVIVPPRLLSMTAHYEWCLRQAKGQWVSIIGDDDGVMPYFFSEVESLLDRWSERSIDAFSFRRAYYFWPGCEDVYGDAVLLVSGQRHEYRIFPKFALLRALFLDLNHFDLPQIYTNNLVRRELIEKIRLKLDGYFYHELNPDVFSGVAVALHAKKWVRSEYPLFWTGTSPKSIGIATSGKLNAAPSQEDLPDRQIFQSRVKDPTLRSKEFFDLAQSDGITVAPEIGLRPWQELRSSPIWVLSALLRASKSLTKSTWLKRVLVLVVCVRASFLLKNDDSVILNRKKDLIKSILVKNNISPGLISLLWPIGAISFLGSFARRVFWKLGSLNKKKGFTEIKSNSHSDYPDLIRAHAEVDRRYHKNRSSISEKSSNERL